MSLPRRSLSPTERRDWLRLSRTERVGPITFRQLLRRFSTAAAALAALPDLARRGGSAKPLAPPSLQRVEDEIAGLEHLGGRFIAWCEPDYPELLAEVEDAPPLLAVLGTPALLTRPCLAVVGARNASLNGRRLAEKLARDLGGAGFVVVSGLARGIDAAAHEASLSMGTIAVVAGGADVVYPEENRDLYTRLVASGAVVSDQPLGCEPRAQMFPRRNRIIAGLCRGVVVVEAAPQSGSLITAHLALEQGREVFAVPGSPLDPRAQGPNDLLRQGATLTENAEDILRALRPLHAGRLAERKPHDPFGEAPPPPVDEKQLEKARAGIRENLSLSPVLIDDLIRHTGLPPGVVMTVLLELELAGQVERQPGHRVALIP